MLQASQQLCCGTLDTRTHTLEECNLVNLGTSPQPRDEHPAPQMLPPALCPPPSLCPSPHSLGSPVYFLPMCVIHSLQNLIETPSCCTRFARSGCFCSAVILTFSAAERLQDALLWAPALLPPCAGSQAASPFTCSPRCQVAAPSCAPTSDACILSKAAHSPERADLRV